MLSWVILTEDLDIDVGHGVVAHLVGAGTLVLAGVPPVDVGQGQDHAVVAQLPGRDLLLVLPGAAQLDPADRRGRVPVGLALQGDGGALPDHDLAV